MIDRLTALGVPEGNPSRITYLILFFAIFGWPYIARIVRGQVISLREREFVEAATAMGASRWRIIITELVPEPLGPGPRLLRRSRCPGTSRPRRRCRSSTSARTPACRPGASC